MKFALFHFLLFFSFVGSGQRLDSLKAELVKDPNNLAILNDLAYEYTYEDLDSARMLLTRAIKLNSTDSLQLGISKETLAIVDEIQGKIPSAIALHYESIAIFEAIGSKKYLAWAYNGMGALHYQQYDYDQALSYFLRSMRMRKLLNDPVEVAKSMINIALIFNTKSQYDSSLFYLNEALPPFIASGDQLMESIIYSNLGSTYSYKGELEDAAIYFNKTRVIQEQINNKEGLGVLYRKLGELSVANNKLKQALDYYDLSLKLTKELGDIGRYTETTQSKYLVYESMKEFQLAYDLQTEYLLLRDSLINIENKDIINEYSAKYQAEQKERTIAELELQKKNAALVLAKSNNQRNVLIALSLTVVVVTILLFILFRQKRKSLGERDVLLKEIHHRVKNNLQIISSLLNLQAGSLEDEAAKEAVREGQYRVKSMALIHQKLYSTDDIRGVEAQDYFENLFGELFIAFGVDRENIQFEVKAGRFNLDIDTLIPLGLIVNELITNALKYAFGETKQGLIALELHEREGKLLVMLKDNGKGMDEEAMQSANSFGWKMIRSLSRKLKAEIVIRNDNGTKVKLIIARYKLAV